MKLDDILHVEAHCLGTEVVSLARPGHSARTAEDRSRQQSRGCIDACRSALNNGTLQVALAEPLDPARADEIQFAVKRDVQVVVADPAEIDRAIERLYGQGESGKFFGNPEGDRRRGARTSRAKSPRPPTMPGSRGAWPTRFPS